MSKKLKLRTLLVVLGALGALASASPALVSATTPAPAVTVSPLRGTPDASPSTQISFLGAPAANLSHIVVSGSLSGAHYGALKAYATGSGASFLPARPFVPGETVTVHATVRVPGAAATIGTTFKVAALNPLSADAPHYFPSLPGTVLSFTSRPALQPPSVTVTTPAADPALGDIFLTPVYGDSQAGPMIVSPTGRLVWFAPEPFNSQAADLQVQQYLGRPVLTYWQGQIALGHGIGDGIIRNSSYQQIATVHAGNGLVMDMHDFTLGANGVAYITIFDPVHYNLSSVGGPADGLVDDAVIQEIDVRTGLVMFEWHALGHIPLSDSHSVALADPTSIYDYFHINRIQVLANDDLLINSRNTWATYKISQGTGAVLWQLGGRHSSFKLGPGVRFAWQHDASLMPNGTIQTFDNESLPQIRAASRGIDIGLDFKTHTATLLHSYVDPKLAVQAPSQGDVQALPNGDHLNGWGQIGFVSEVNASGHLTFAMELASSVQSYRAYRYPWHATPTTKPALSASRATGVAATSLAASWNGATTVHAWRVLAGNSPTTLRAVGAAVPDISFETQLSALTSAPYVAVRALGAGGVILATSHVVAVAP